MKKENKIGEGFGELVEVMARLRGKRGCPWDKEQTHVSLKPYLLEESYELLEAIDKGDPQEMAEELGDVMHQIVFHCQIAAEEGRFTAEEVISRLKEKMTRRHPHVFSDPQQSDSGTVLQNWVKAKAEEKQEKTSASALGDLPRAMPALARAQAITERASLLGFDWPTIEPVWDKLEEELAELKAVASSEIKHRASDEMGDVFFCLVNLCRFLDLRAEDALARTVDRFLERFAYIEATIREKGKPLAEASFEEMDALWDEAKQLERRVKL